MNNLIIEFTPPVGKSEDGGLNHTQSILKMNSTPRLLESTIINQHQNFGWIESQNYPYLSISKTSPNIGKLLYIVVF